MNISDPTFNRVSNRLRIWFMELASEVCRFVPDCFYEVEVYRLRDHPFNASMSFARCSEGFWPRINHENAVVAVVAVFARSENLLAFNMYSALRDGVGLYSLAPRGLTLEQTEEWMLKCVDDARYFVLSECEPLVEWLLEQPYQS